MLIGQYQTDNARILVVEIKSKFYKMSTYLGNLVDI